jgi:hypothetical protein
VPTLEKYINFLGSSRHANFNEYISFTFYVRGMQSSTNVPQLGKYEINEAGSLVLNIGIRR